MCNIHCTFVFSRQSSHWIFSPALSSSFLQLFPRELPVHISGFLMTSANTSNFHTLLFKNKRNENMTALIIRDNSTHNCPRTHKTQRLISWAYLKRKQKAADSGGGCGEGKQNQQSSLCCPWQHHHTTEGWELATLPQKSMELLQEQRKPKSNPQMPLLKGTWQFCWDLATKSSYQAKAFTDELGF